MIQSFEEFLISSQTNIPVLGFLINLVLTAILSTLLSWLYTIYGESLSNRKQFGKNFLLITMTTMLIITIVKSSLALSLGLVGALSIIRFRAAIKEPEELAYLFLAIAIGLGLGANQTAITVLAFILISVIIIIKQLTKKSQENQNLHLTIKSHGENRITTEAVIDILKKHCEVVHLRRFDETDEAIELSFMVELIHFNEISNAKSELQDLNKHLKITFIDNKGLL